MDPRADGAIIRSLPHAFINKRGEAIMINTLDEELRPQLVEMYLKYEPRGSFQGLPPLSDAACVRWVHQMIEEGINLVALSFRHGILGHTALFTIDQRACENLVVVVPAAQNIGIGTELTRCVIQLAHEIGFEAIRLSVDATNVRARHVYKKCGFDYLEYCHTGEVEMEMNLKHYRDTVSVSVSEIMNRKVLSIPEEIPCREAMRLFLTHGVGSLPVVDEEKRLVGILSKTDLMLPAQIHRKVGDVLTRAVVTVPENSPISKVIRLFQSKRIRSIPVVNDKNQLVGIVGRGDILAYYERLFTVGDR